MDKKINEAEDEEEHYSKMVTLLENSVDSTEKHVKKLENEKKRLSYLRD